MTSGRCSSPCSPGKHRRPPGEAPPPRGGQRRLVRGAHRLLLAAPAHRPVALEEPCTGTPPAGRRRASPTRSRLPCAGRYARPPAERKNPRLGIIDSQSVKGADTLGLPIVVCVMAVSVQERDGAKTTLLSLYLATPVRFVFADAGFAGALVAWTARVLSTTLYIVRKGPAQVGFAVIGRRWVVADPDLVDLPPAAGTQLRAPAPGGRGDGVLGRDRANGPPSDPRPRRDPPAGMDVSGSCFLPPSQARS